MKYYNNTTIEKYKRLGIIKKFETEGGIILTKYIILSQINYLALQNFKDQIIDRLYFVKNIKIYNN